MIESATLRLMKIAYIILAHKNPRQVVRLIRRLNVPDKTTFYVHIDKKSASNIYDNIAEEVKALGNVKMLKRYDSAWGSFGIVEATMEGLKQAVESDDPFDYLVNLSGQDYPIKSNERIRAKLSASENCSYIWYLTLPFEGSHPTKGEICQRLNRYEYWHLRYHNWHVRLPSDFQKYRRIFSVERSILWMLSNLFLPKKRKFFKNFILYGGGQWWCLRKSHAEYIHNFLESNREYYSFYKNTHIPDESFFQTILLNSAHKNEIINDDLRLLYFEGADSHPKIYQTEDFAEIASSEQLFVRKFDITRDENILDLIDNSHEPNFYHAARL